MNLTITEAVGLALTLPVTILQAVRLGDMKRKFTIIHGNVIYEVSDVDYKSSDTHRRFTRDGVLILSVPINSVLIQNGCGIKAKIVNGLNTASQDFTQKKNEPKEIHSDTSDDSFIEGVVVGGIVGSFIF